jgi:hypothetical protein
MFAQRPGLFLVAIPTAKAIPRPSAEKDKSPDARIYIKNQKIMSFIKLFGVGSDLVSSSFALLCRASHPAKEEPHKIVL